ncbi:MAG TPA: hypothetical protein DCZ92_10050 [Elusimicrobia bacterium]|nr:MAG: hypothetical protein A2016_07375 [Elusimicrobia bacterium GWF2_62_30]HBA61141.1 hypothetical protein [Elusimicrobiota bacterium]
MTALLEKIKNFESPVVPVLVVVFAVFMLIWLPYRVIGYGYLPQDDVTRHSAKVISGKDWKDILVLRDDIRMDSHPGWHSILGAVHKATRWPPYDLAVFSVASLFILAALLPVFLTKRPEAWILALLIIAVVSFGVYYRLLMGRPFLVTTAYMLAFGFTWQKLRGPRPYAAFAAMTLFGALSTWIHCGWYLLALPCAALFLAREWRACALLSLSVLAGVLAGAALTGQPVMFLVQTTRHFFLSLGDTPQHLLAAEFQPAGGDYGVLLVFLLFIMWRFIRNKWDVKAVDNPVFLLLCACWVLGFLVGRVWDDIGLAAGLVWITLELEQLLESSAGFNSPRRLLISAAAVCLLFLAVTNDAAGRWSLSRPGMYITPEKVQDVSWLPGDGGIVYSDNMNVFYNMFFRNPLANWRYMVGFEPALMPKEDLAVFRDIQLKRGAKEAYAPWVAKMRPEDRLIRTGSSLARPAIEGLEWNFIADAVWCGRLPAKKAGR